MKMYQTILTAVVAVLSLNAFAVPITATSGSDFTVDYDAIGGDPVTSVDGLTASVRYYDFNFLYDLSTNTTSLSFDFDVSNTSSLPILTSRVTTLGFLTTPDVILGGSSVSGIFDTVDSGNVPNQGSVEFCFSDVNCAGGGSGGVAMGDTQTGSALLSFLGNFSSINFDNFTIRYQSVSCIDGYDGNCPGSASGGPTTDVPEPGMVGLLAIGLLGVVAARRRMKA